MADRRDIRAAVYDEIEAAVDDVSGVTASDVRGEAPNSAEDLPRVVHADDYRPVPMNEATRAPHETIRSGGRVDEIIVYSIVEGQFGISVMGHDEKQRESLYEAIRRQFGVYDQWLPASELHPSANKVTVGTTNSTDAETSPVTRSDRVLVNVEFTRDFHIVRADLADGSEDATFSGVFDNISSVVEQSDGTELERFIQ